MMNPKITALYLTHVHVVRAQGENARAWTRQFACFPRNAYGGVHGTKMISIDIRKDSECREFDCSYGWSQKYCEYFQKECIYDTKDNKCKDKNPRKKGIWETANDHIESTTGRRLDGK
ncbi:predicted protein [Lichtheimia corymbifera JMRC:FSU:9682]|uniref:Uncharacterized protein n=1 Tax=Lichtheimia corymbifera JMRC:FSU:9682 TaxID=1263082 RepID=A0A068S8K3_9FUNG|nr:predicted protein [Lichtheimia corymbifera JMRC:FSU:9682]